MMNSGLLFYLARRTAVCQDIINRAIKNLGMEISAVKVCMREDYINRCMANLLKNSPVVFLIGDSPLSRPGCADFIFKTLKIPLDRKNEPKGVMKLYGTGKTGYLIESCNQAIIVFPDIPGEIIKMLPAACERLGQKFELDGRLPNAPEIDYEKLIADCVTRMEDKL